MESRMGRDIQRRNDVILKNSQEQTSLRLCYLDLETLRQYAVYWWLNLVTKCGICRNFLNTANESR